MFGGFGATSRTAARRCSTTMGDFSVRRWSTRKSLLAVSSSRAAAASASAEHDAHRGRDVLLLFTCRDWLVLAMVAVSGCAAGAALILRFSLVGTFARMVAPGHVELESVVRLTKFMAVYGSMARGFAWICSIGCDHLKHRAKLAWTRFSAQRIVRTSRVPALPRARNSALRADAV